MSDYIKREDAIRTMAKYMMDMALIDNPEASDRIEQWEGSIAAPVMSTVKAADVVEVVRCKDCKYKPNGYTDDDVLRYPNFPHKENNPCPCQVYEDEWYSWIPNDDFYCSYGERADT